jgi:hypothetical protein
MIKLAPATLLLSLAALGACSHSSSASNDATFSDYRTQGAADTAAGNSTTANLGVNAFLWRGSLDTLSFMPLVSADPFGGVIITDWYTPQGVTGERFKATVYILSRELRADGLRVSIFRQTNDGTGWQDAQVAATTETDIEDKILARARELRAKVR